MNWLIYVILAVVTLWLIYELVTFGVKLHKKIKEKKQGEEENLEKGE